MEDRQKLRGEIREATRKMTVMELRLLLAFIRGITKKEEKDPQGTDRGGFSLAKGIHRWTGGRFPGFPAPDRYGSRSSG